MPVILKYGVIPGIRVTAEREINISVDEGELSRCYSVVHVVAREELQEVSCSPKETMENTACSVHVSAPRVAGATSPIWRFGSEAKILQLP